MAKDYNRNKWWNRRNKTSPTNLQSTDNNNLSFKNGSKSVSFKLPDPTPDYIYTNRKNRTNPEKALFNNTGWTTYIPERLEHIKGEGNFVYYYGCPYPSKCIAEDKAIYAVVPVKRRFINLIKLAVSLNWRGIIFLLGKKSRAKLLNTILQAFNEEAETTMSPFYMDDYYSQLVRQIQKASTAFMVSLAVNEEIAQKAGENIGCMFEYDNAYRYIVHDLFNETSKEALLRDFPNELERLLKLNAQRDHRGENNYVHGKFLSAGKLLKLIWYIPTLRKAIKGAINAIDWDKVKLDEADVYHTLLYDGYDTMGRTLQERWNLYVRIHGEDQTKWPPRITVRNKQPV